MLGKVAHDFLCDDPKEMKIPELAKQVKRQKPSLEDEDMPRQTSSNRWEQMLIDINYDNGFHDGRDEALRSVVEQLRSANCPEEYLVLLEPNSEALTEE